MFRMMKKKSEKQESFPTFVLDVPNYDDFFLEKSFIPNSYIPSVLALLVNTFNIELVSLTMKYIFLKK